MRRCSRCERDLPLDAFNRHRGGHQWWCRECFRTYFRKRGGVHLRQVRKSQVQRRAVLRRFLVEFLDEHPCTDCATADTRVLEFDHVREGHAYISRLVATGVSLQLLRAEIGRCEVVCANCHRRRTAERAGWKRLTRPDEPFHWRAHVDAKLRWVYEQLDNAACVDCGLADGLVLEHDHIGTKRKSVMKLVWEGHSREVIEREIEQCEVRCCNCHRLRTYETQASYRCAG